MQQLLDMLNKQGLCHDEAFNPFNPRMAEYNSYRFCQVCPVMVQCRGVLKANKDESGLWGGAYRDQPHGKIREYFTVEQWRYGENDATGQAADSAADSATQAVDETPR